MRKKLVSILITVTMFSTLLAGCGNTGNENVPETDSIAAETAKTETDMTETADTKENVTLSMMNFYTKEEAESGDNTRRCPREAILEFDEQNDDISLDITEIQHNDYQTKIQALASADDLPDVFIVKGSWVQNFYDSGLLADISSYVNDCEWKDQYRDGLYDGVTVGEEIVGAPMQFSATSIVFYNKDLWQQAGYDSFPSTWEEVFAAKAKFDEMGIDTIALGNSDKWQYNSSWTSAIANHITGSDWTESIIDNTGAAFTDDGFKQFLQLTEKIGQSGILNKDYESINNQAASDSFMNGQAATTIDGYWNVEYMAGIASDEMKEKIAYAPVPAPAEGCKGDTSSVSTGCGWFVCVNNKLEGTKLDAAAKLALYISGPAFSQKMSDVGLIGPCKTVATDPNAFDVLNQKYLTFMDGISSSCTIYDSRINASVIETMNDQFVELLAGATDVDTAAETIQSEYESIQ